MENGPKTITALEELSKIHKRIEGIYNRRPGLYMVQLPMQSSEKMVFVRPTFPKNEVKSQQMLGGEVYIIDGDGIFPIIDFTQENS